jgi:ankyrin repeat protein
MSADTMTRYIVSSSKGLVEVTKSKDRVAQFIHLSVSDFLLEGGGLSQLWEDLAQNSSGLSQVRLRECCSNYLRSPLVSSLGANLDLPAVSSLEADILRGEAARRFEFLEYAVQYVFTHAESAAAEGMTQDSFVQNIEFSNWVQLNNIWKPQEQLHLPSDISLLDMCVERNYSNLVGTVMQNGLYTRGQIGWYHNPLFAAIAHDCHEALEALIEFDSRLFQEGDVFPWSSANLCSFLADHCDSAHVPRLISSFYVFDTTWMLEDGEPLICRVIRGTQVVRKRPIKTFKALLEKGINVNAQGGRYGNALQAASAIGDVEMVKLLLEQGAEVNVQGGYYGNALQAAARCSVEIVKCLLKEGADVNAQGGYYGNALQAASCNIGHVEVVTLLQKHGVDVNAQAKRYSNVFQAATIGSREIVEFLLKEGADVNARGGHYGSALQAASYSVGYVEMVELLRKKGADGNTQGAHNLNYDDVLQATSFSTKNTKVLELLLGKDADANAQGGKYGSALQAASASGSEERVTLLLENGAIDVQGGRYGNSFAAASASSDKVVELLLHKCLSISRITLRDELPEASVRGHENTVQLAEDAGFEAYDECYYKEISRLSYDECYCKAISRILKSKSEWIMIKNNRERVVELLLHKGNNISGKTLSRALGLASYSGYVKVVQILLAWGADINAYGGVHGNALLAVLRSPFFWMKSTDRESIVQLLLYNRTEISGSMLNTALQTASSKGYKKIVQLLLAKGRYES